MINGHPNGHSNGHANGYANGHTNGHANGHGLNERPCTNGHSDGVSLPSSFLAHKTVRTVYGLVPLKYALDWPVWASYNELAGCASWMGGRIPTFEETRSIYAHANTLKREEAERQLGKTVPAVNGYAPQAESLSHRRPVLIDFISHLINDGVEETPPERGTGKPVKEEQDDLFLDLDEANVGFQHWHPTSITADGNRLCGQGEMGGVWEWTSSPLKRWEEFEPMALYPLYTGEKHMATGTNPQNCMANL